MTVQTKNFAEALASLRKPDPEMSGIQRLRELFEISLRCWIPFVLALQQNDVVFEGNNSIPLLRKLIEMAEIAL